MEGYGVNGRICQAWMMDGVGSEMVAKSFTSLAKRMRHLSVEIEHVD